MNNQFKLTKIYYEGYFTSYHLEAGDNQEIKSTQIQRGLFNKIYSIFDNNTQELEKLVSKIEKILNEKEFYKTKDIKKQINVLKNLCFISKHKTKSTITANGKIVKLIETIALNILTKTDNNIVEIKNHSLSDILFKIKTEIAELKKIYSPLENYPVLYKTLNCKVLKLIEFAVSNIEILVTEIGLRCLPLNDLISVKNSIIQFIKDHQNLFVSNTKTQMNALLYSVQGRLSQRNTIDQLTKINNRLNRMRKDTKPQLIQIRSHLTRGCKLLDKAISMMESTCFSSSFIEEKFKLNDYFNFLKKDNFFKNEVEMLKTMRSDKNLSQENRLNLINSLKQLKQKIHNYTLDKEKLVKGSEILEKSLQLIQTTNFSNQYLEEQLQLFSFFNFLQDDDLFKESVDKLNTMKSKIYLNRDNKLEQINLLKDFKEKITQSILEKSLQETEDKFKKEYSKEIKEALSIIETLLTRDNVFDNWHLIDCFELYSIVCELSTRFIDNKKDQMEITTYIDAIIRRIERKKLKQFVEMIPPSSEMIPIISDHKNQVLDLINNLSQVPKYTSESFDDYLKNIESWIHKTSKLKALFSPDTGVFSHPKMKDLMKTLTNLTKAELQNQTDSSFLSHTKDIFSNLKLEKSIYTYLGVTLDGIIKGCQATLGELSQFNRQLNDLLRKLNSNTLTFPLKLSLPFKGPVLTIKTEKELKLILEAHPGKLTDNIGTIKESIQSRTHGRIQSLNNQLFSLINVLAKDYLEPLNLLRELVL